MHKIAALLVVLRMVTAVSEAAWPWGSQGVCSPVTDAFTCLSCAGALYEACYTSCEGEDPYDGGCNRECATAYRADLADCHSNFDPITY